MRIGVVWNRAARRARYLPVPKLFPEAEIETPWDTEQAVATARRMAGECATVVAAGGDGTVNAVVNGLAGSEAALGIVPAGTGNVLAAALGLPLNNPRLAARVCLGDTERVIDVAKCGTRWFAASAGYGLDAAVIPKADELKHLFGRGAFVLVALARQFTERPWKVTIRSADETLYDGLAVLVAIVNAGKYGGLFHVSKDVSCSDGRLDLAVLTPGAWPPCGIAGPALRACLSTASGSRRVRVFQRASFRVEAPDGIPAHVDGERCETPGFEIDCLPGGLRVKTPAD